MSDVSTEVTTALANALAGLLGDLERRTNMYGGAAIHASKREVDAARSALGLYLAHRTPKTEGEV